VCLVLHCIPGCRRWQSIDEKTYSSAVTAKVGTISVKFEFATTFTEVIPLRYLKAVGGREDVKKNGIFSQETVVDLREVSEDEVETSLRSNISIGGRPATFGDRIMRAKPQKRRVNLPKL